MTRIIFNRAARFVCEFAEVDLEGVRRRTEHVDVSAGAEDPRLQTRDDNSPHFRMFEPESLNRVGKLDINAQVIGIKFEFVAFDQRLIFLDIHGKGSHGAIDL